MRRERLVQWTPATHVLVRVCLGSVDDCVVQPFPLSFSTSISHFSGPPRRGRLPISFFFVVSCQQRLIVFPLPLGFYLQKISINRPYAAIPSHSLALGQACRWHHRASVEHRLLCRRPGVPRLW